MSSILTNTSAMVALQTLKGINASLAKTQDEISTGKSVASARDNAAFLRATEGELARTILALPDIRSARVHIARATPQPFRQPERQTASVTVTTATGTLPVEQARAVKHLVAAALAGMTPEDVSVIDSVGGLVETGDDAEAGAQAAERRAGELKRNVERLLAARVGIGNAVVEVALDLETDRETISERTFDPDGRVAISTDTSELSDSSTEPGGDVTVASNLPEGDANQGAAGQSSRSETRERVNFEVSETKRDLLRTPGDIRRITVAVLVNDVVVTAEDGSQTSTPRPQEELDVLRELVAAAIGFDEARGDTITLRSLAFQPAADAGTLVESGMLPRLDWTSIVQMALLAAVIIVIALFVLRPVLMARRAQADPGGERLAPFALPGQPAGLPAPGATGEGFRVLTGEIDDGSDPVDFAMIPSDDRSAGTPPDPVARLRRLIEERQAESLEILRGWMDDKEEKV
jgi:flagellar M-ring protein FliF